jgi:hypothetical protein
MQKKFTNGIKQRITHFQGFRPFSTAKKYAGIANITPIRMSGRRLSNEGSGGGFIIVISVQG